jgi:hypothetical protein
MFGIKIASSSDHFRCIKHVRKFSDSKSRAWIYDVMLGEVVQLW